MSNVIKIPVAMLMDAFCGRDWDYDIEAFRYPDGRPCVHAMGELYRFIGARGPHRDHFMLAYAGRSVLLPAIEAGFFPGSLKAHNVAERYIEARDEFLLSIGYQPTDLIEIENVSRLLDPRHFDPRFL